MNGEFLGISATVWVILASAAVTYATRFGGHVVLSRMKRIPPRVEVALNAVPAAVITTLVAPALVSHGVGEVLTLAAACILGLRLPMMAMFLIGWVLIVALRSAGI